MCYRKMYIMDKILTWIGEICALAFASMHIVYALWGRYLKETVIFLLK